MSRRCGRSGRTRNRSDGLFSLLHLARNTQGSMCQTWVILALTSHMPWSIRRRSRRGGPVPFPAELLLNGEITRT